MFYKIKEFFIKLTANICVFKSPLFFLFNGYGYKIKAKHQREIINIIKPGDILLRRYDHYLTGLFIPGYWTHAAIYAGEDKIIHAVTAGICEEDILMFTRTDNIMVLRPVNSYFIDDAVNTAKSKLNKNISYDFEFSPTTDRFYCSELIAHCYNNITIPSYRDKYILPDDLLRTNGFEVIWEKED